jgi:hypothetical protein
MSAKDRYLAAVAKHPPGGPRVAPVKPVEKRHRECARAVLRKGKTIYESLLAMGYSEKQSKKGLATVRNSHALKTAFQQEAQRIEKDAKKAPLFPNEGALEGLIMSRLESNIVKGVDKAVMSCKLAGSHKKLALWEAEGRAGVIIVNAPGSAILAHTDVPEDAE